MNEDENLMVSWVSSQQRQFRQSAVIGTLSYIVFGVNRQLRTEGKQSTRKRDILTLFIAADTT